MRELTQEELKFINATAKCPVCEEGGLLCGPQGGCSMNVKCDNPECRVEFCLGLVGGEGVWVGSIIDRDLPEAYNRGRLRFS